MYNPNTTDNQEELYDVVDQNDVVIATATRREVHGNPRLIHRAAGGYIFNRKKELLMQKRSKTKDMYPLHWAFSVGGHVDSGDTYERAVARELKEELGIDIPLTFLEKRFVPHEFETEFWSIYYGIHDGPFPAFNTIEMDEVRFISLDTLNEMIAAGRELFVPEVAKLMPKVEELVQSGKIDALLKEVYA